jgi:hypothetical protein
MNKKSSFPLYKFFGGMVTANGLVLAAWRHRSRKAFQQNKNSWKNTLSQTTSSHDAKTVLADGA